MRAILLDMYGVIVKQTGDELVPYVHRTFPERTPEEIYASWLKADVGEIPSLQIWREIGYRGDLAAVEKDYLDTIELNDGLTDFLRLAKERCRLAIVSNDSSEWSRYLRQKFSLDPYFDAVSVSGDLYIQKPDERIFRITLDALGVRAADCVYVDDRRTNLRAAAGMGMRAVMLNSRHVKYDGETIDSFAELKELLFGR